MTRREDSGLALSSRNGRLSADEKAKAALLSQLLMSDLTDAEVRAQLDAEGFKTEYVATRWGRRLAAVRLGDVRLIDNVGLGEIMQKKEKA
jgi:pantoate--beta-alanine ligase